MPDQDNLRVFNFEVKLHHGREATIQESGAAAHLGSTFRKQRETNASAQLTFHLCAAQDATRGRMPLTDSVGLSPLTNLELSSQTSLEDCLCDDLKTHQVDEQD